MSPQHDDRTEPTLPPPGPGVQDPALEEPTQPVAPPPPKPSQAGPRTGTPTGAPTGAPPEAVAQQGEYLTTSQGARLRDTDHSLRAGPRGPVLLQDHHLREKITEETQLTAGADPDDHRRDLYDALDAGAYASWDLGVQVMPDSERRRSCSSPPTSPVTSRGRSLA